MIEDNYDCKFVSRNNSDIVISIRGKQEAYKIIKLFEFNSARKMMSVSVIRLSDNTLINFAKGADTSITQRLNKQNPLEQAVIDEVEVYANTGLRTLMFGMRYLSKELVGLNALQQDIEKEYMLLGVTGVEDML